MYHLRPSVSLPPRLSRNSDPGSHSRLFSPHSPLRFVPCISIARRFQLFLPSSTRVELCLPTLGALSSLIIFLFLQITSKSHHGRNSRTNAINSSIVGLPLDHRGVYTALRSYSGRYPGTPRVYTLLRSYSGSFSGTPRLHTGVPPEHTPY